MSPYRQSSLPKFPPKTSWYRLIWAHLTRMVFYKLYLRNKLRRYYRDVELTGGWYKEHLCDDPQFCEMCKRPIHPKCGVFKKDGTYYGRSIRFNELELKQFYFDIHRLEYREKYALKRIGTSVPIYTSTTRNETCTEPVEYNDEYKDWPSNSWERGEEYISAAILVPKENK